MKSVIDMVEVVGNKDRVFGAALEYYPCAVILPSGDEVKALFTLDQINTAVERAERNPEDLPEDKTLWDILFGG